MTTLLILFFFYKIAPKILPKISEANHAALFDLQPSVARFLKPLFLTIDILILTYITLFRLLDPL